MQTSYDVTRIITEQNIKQKLKDTIHIYEATNCNLQGKTQDLALGT